MGKKNYGKSVKTRLLNLIGTSPSQIIKLRGYL